MMRCPRQGGVLVPFRPILCKPNAGEIPLPGPVETKTGALPQKTKSWQTTPRSGIVASDLTKTPSLRMKTILVTLSAASLVLLSTSCRTIVPVDPNKRKPSCSMMPDPNAKDYMGRDCLPCSKTKGVVAPSK